MCCRPTSRYPPPAPDRQRQPDPDLQRRHANADRGVHRAATAPATAGLKDLPAGSVTHALAGVSLFEPLGSASSHSWIRVDNGAVDVLAQDASGAPLSKLTEPGAVKFRMPPIPRRQAFHSLFTGFAVHHVTCMAIQQASSRHGADMRSLTTDARVGQMTPPCESANGCL